MRAKNKTMNLSDAKVLVTQLWDEYFAETNKKTSTYGVFAKWVYQTLCDDDINQLNKLAKTLPNYQPDCDCLHSVLLAIDENEEK